jgi:hypothetical protein
MIEVNATYFRAAAQCQSQEDSRYYLQGVYIQPHPIKGAVLTATDGRRLISIYDKEGECSAARIIAIDPKAIDDRAMSAMTKAKIVAPKVRVDDDGIATIGTYRSLKTCVIDGSFPDWITAAIKPVLQSEIDGKYTPASFNHEYLVSFSKIARMLGNASIRMISFSESGQALIRFGDVDFAFAVLMPMRTTITNSIPSWMQPILAPPPVLPEPSPPEPSPPEPAPSATEAEPKAPTKRHVKKPASKNKSKKSAKRKVARR